MKDIERFAGDDYFVLLEFAFTRETIDQAIELTWGFVRKAEYITELTRFVSMR